ncbi:hypothetical protein [Myroides sp. WP-1]|uniref:hypothetical protein n=1 Tax=Myroides sp. WP-1 TaxID=2759944 RepID=UPI0015FCECB3|nr:hypothetical protein [Myroides sp. WP-1]MBB1139574.1 hypothetical protein [Myroides sp. WP-1]
MKEIVELRVNCDYVYLLFKVDESKNLETSVKVVEVDKEDPLYNQISVIREEVKNKYGQSLFFGWRIKRKYTKRELALASLLHVKIKTSFEPAGEECGTLYDETVACSVCGANRKQLTTLILKKGKIPKKDIVRTLGGEVVVSKKFVNAVRQRNLKGLQFIPTNVENYYQLITNTEVELSSNTIVGIDPWDFSTCSEEREFTVSGDTPVQFEKEIYKCPKGDTIGLNMLSEPYLLNSKFIGDFDFFSSRQKVGVKRGLLRPEAIYICSQEFKKMIDEEKLTGIEFEIAHIESDFSE